ncbi:MAG: hypothetical protein WD875_18305 [Pirellulales bacterium]
MKSHRFVRGCLVTLAWFLSVFVSAGAADAEIVLWGNGTRIMRTDFAAGTTTELLSTEEYVRDLAVDLSSRKLYWSDGRIWRSNLDGSAAELLVVSHGVIGIALDTVREKLYWTDASIEDMWRSNLDGTSIENCTTSPIPFPCPTDPKLLEVDSADGKIYWSVNQGVQGANLDGSGYQDLYNVPPVTIPPRANNPRDIALDVAGNSLYFSAEPPGKILRIDLGDGSVETLVAYTDGQLEPIPTHLTLEPVNRNLYWLQANAENAIGFPNALVRYDIATGALSSTPLGGMAIDHDAGPIVAYIPEPNTLMLAISAAAGLFFVSASRILHRRLHRAARV